MYIKFKYKLLAILCAVLFLSVSIISAIWYTYSKQMIVENVYKSMSVLLKERNKAFFSSIENVVNQTRALSYNNNIVDRYLNNKWQDPYLNAQANQKFTDAVTGIYVNNPLIQSIEIGSDSGASFFLGESLGEEFVKEKIPEEIAEEISTDVLLIGTGNDPYDPEEIVLYRNILYYGKKIGYCMVTLVGTNGPQVYEDNFPEDAVISVTGKDKSYLYTSPTYKEVLQNKLLMQAMEQMNGEQKNVRDDDGNEWLLLSQYEGEELLKSCVAIPIDSMLGDMKSRFANIFLIVGITMGMLLLVVGFATRWIGRNVDILSNAIQKFSQGSFDTHINLNSKDEFGKVADAFNSMTGDIKQLMTDIRIKEKEKATLEIRSLQGQINLHFLFNTLNTIKNLCYVQRVTNVEHLVDALMQLLHVSMEQEKEYIELKKELEYINHYLEIYQYKSLYPIRCFMDVEPEIADAMVLKFSIQPIVENAIIHGLEGNDKEEDGLIYIKAIKLEEDIEITVTDNGRGFDTKKMATFNGIGLANTEKRLKIHFGEVYGIRAESVEGISTSVTIRLPYRRKIDENQQD